MRINTLEDSRPTLFGMQMHDIGVEDDITILDRDAYNVKSSAEQSTGSYCIGATKTKLPVISMCPSSGPVRGIGALTGDRLTCSNIKDRSSGLKSVKEGFGLWPKNGDCRDIIALEDRSIAVVAILSHGGVPKSGRGSWAGEILRN
jgi:hypothetical protein